MIKEAIAQLIEVQDISGELAQKAMEEIMRGEASNAQIAAFLVSLRLKGETIDEIAACAKVMRAHVTKVNIEDPHLLDTCGTGGDQSGTFNISTASGLVAAASGIKVAKHGNKSVSSKCGSADVLLELGVKLDIEVEKVEIALSEIGFGFLYAPLLHPAMKYAMPVRKELGVRTIFNILGPLTNPAGATCQLLGVFSRELTESLAYVLKNLGSKHVLVVHGEDGLDELSTTTTSRVSELKGGRVTSYDINPQDYGMALAKPEDLKGGDAPRNAEIIMDVLKGSKSPARDIVVLNAGCAIYVADKVSSINEGIEKANEAIDSGAALKVLERLKEFTNKA